MNGNGHVFGVEAGMRICWWVHVCKIGVHVLTLASYPVPLFLRAGEARGALHAGRLEASAHPCYQVGMQDTLYNKYVLIKTNKLQRKWSAQ